MYSMLGGFFTDNTYFTFFTSPSFFMTVGILAFQGNVAEHRAILTDLALPSIDVRSVADLDRCDGLIIPGGESTVMSQFLLKTGLMEDIRRRVLSPDIRSPLRILGTCAGAILLAQKVISSYAVPSLQLLDIDVQRNAYGSQVDSFDVLLKVKGVKTPVHGSFIRAPKMTRIGSDVEVLAEHGGVPVLVRLGSIVACTFHPEMRSSRAIHELLFKKETEK